MNIGKNKLSDSIGIGMIIFYFIILGETLYFYSKDKFLDEEFRIILGMLIPMFAVYLTTIIKSFITHQSTDYSKDVPVMFRYIFISVLIPLLYCLTIIFAIVHQATVGKWEFKDFTTVLTSAQTVFGAYTGYIIADMFGKLQKK